MMKNRLLDAAARYRPEPAPVGCTWSGMAR
jgi:hypothetical protein